MMLISIMELVNVKMMWLMFMVVFRVSGCCVVILVNGCLVF